MNARTHTTTRFQTTPHRIVRIANDDHRSVNSPNNLAFAASDRAFNVFSIGAALAAHRRSVNEVCEVLYGFDSGRLRAPARSVSLDDDGDFGADFQRVVFLNSGQVNDDERYLRTREEHRGEWSKAGPRGGAHETILSRGLTMRDRRDCAPDVAVLNRLGHCSEVVEFDVDDGIRRRVVSHVDGAGKAPPQPNTDEQSCKQ